MRAFGSLKQCARCKEIKNISEYHKSSRNVDGLKCYCKKCRKELSVEKGWTRKSNNKRTPMDNFVFKLKNLYGVTYEDFLKLLDEQNNKCLICNKHIERGRGLHIDHNHETGEIRGLLCDKCNVGLGSFKDSPYLLKKAIGYLQEKGYYGDVEYGNSYEEVK